MARMNLPIAVLCGDCKFWNQIPLEAYKDVFGDVEGEPLADPTVGVCELALHVSKDSKGNHNQPAAGFNGSMVVKDASAYMASLWTKNTHGCLAGVASNFPVLVGTPKDGPNPIEELWKKSINRTAANQFPDLGYELPTIEGYQDTSWRNDACASMETVGGSIRIWFDYADQSKRESLSQWQYRIETGGDTLLLSNDLNEVIAVATKVRLHDHATWLAERAAGLPRS